MRQAIVRRSRGGANAQRRGQRWQSGGLARRLRHPPRCRTPPRHPRRNADVPQLGGRPMIWVSSTIRKSPGQTLEEQTIGAPPEYWTEVIRPGDPHRGQASTATKLGAKDSRNDAKSSRNKMSPGAKSASDPRFDMCKSAASCSARPELAVPCIFSCSDAESAFRDLLPCFAIAIKALVLFQADGLLISCPHLMRRG